MHSRFGHGKLVERWQVARGAQLRDVPVQRRVAAGVLSAGHARAILSTGSPDEMERLADKIVNEDLSVRAARARPGCHLGGCQPWQSSPSARNSCYPIPNNQHPVPSTCYQASNN